MVIKGAKKMIKTENLTKEYNGSKAVDGLNLEIAEGEIFGFLGPNGAGKSTTILMLVGMIEPTEGRCTINGIDVMRNPFEVKRIIGYLPENAGFYGHKTATQNLDYFARFYGMNTEERNKRIQELLELVHLEDVKQKAGEYSKGMLQRLGFAQALLNDPKVLFLDEPTANLDPEGVIEFRNWIKRLSEEGKTIFLSSHILAEVSRTCKTIGIITKGKMVAKGNLDEIRAKLGQDKTINIIIETAGAIPEFHHHDIMRAEYDGNKAQICAKSDIRDEISDYLFKSGIRIRGMRVETPSLEDIYLEGVNVKDEWTA